MPISDDEYQSLMNIVSDLKGKSIPSYTDADKQKFNSMIGFHNEYGSELTSPLDSDIHKIIDEWNSTRSNDPNVPYGMSFKNPSNNLGIGFADENKLLWINMRSISIAKQKNFIRPGQATIEKKAMDKEYNFKFLAQLELIESLSNRHMAPQ
jgi:flagellar hook assembly protein FlgD